MLRHSSSSTPVLIVMREPDSHRDTTIAYSYSTGFVASKGSLSPEPNELSVLKLERHYFTTVPVSFLPPSNSKTRLRSAGS